MADFIGSTDDNCTVGLPPLARLFSEVLCSEDGSMWIWFDVPILLRCFGLLEAVSVGFISFLSVPTVPK